MKAFVIFSAVFRVLWIFMQSPELLPPAREKHVTAGSSGVFIRIDDGHDSYDTDFGGFCSLQ